MTYFQRCQSLFSTPFVVLARISFLDGAESSTVWDHTSGPSIYRRQTVLSSGFLWAEPVTAIWQSGDLSHFPSEYAAALEATVAAIQTSSISKIATNTTSVLQRSGLSTGSKAEIAVSAVLGIELLAEANFLFMRRRQRAREPASALPEMSGPSFGFKRLFQGRWRT